MNMKEIPVLVAFRNDDETIPSFIKEKLNKTQPFDKQLIYNKLFTENGKTNLDIKLEEHLPKLQKSIADISSFKKNIPNCIKSPIGELHINPIHAFNHMNGNNSTKMNRTKYNGNFLQELKNPLLVVKADYQGKEAYYFYNISKDSSGNLVNTLHCLINENNKLHKTFYKFCNGLGKIKKFLREDNIVYCHKLLTDKSIVKSERIHYNNTNSIIHKIDDNVNLANNQKNVVYYGAKKDMILSEFSELKDVFCSENKNTATISTIEEL